MALSQRERIQSGIYKTVLHGKKKISFSPSPAGMSLTKLSQGEFGIKDNLYYIVKLKGVHPARSYC
jgi:hypothetical protein